MSESENSGGQVITSSFEAESVTQTPTSTDISKGNQGSGGESGGAELREDQRQTTAGSSGTQSEGSHNAYPLPSEIGEKEREAEAQKEDQQQSSGADSGQQEQQQEQREERSEEKQQEGSGGDDEQKEKKEGDEDEGNKKQGTKPGATRENPDSIPTAGGERLGEKHWGESKMVPDVPQKRDEEGKEGQPDQQTRDNTEKNTGGASSGEHHHGEGGGEGGEEPKQGMVDKIKAKMGLDK